MMRFSSSTRYHQQQQHHFQMKSFAGLTLVLLTISSSLCAPPASAFPQPPYFPQPPEDFGGLFNPWASFFNFSGCHSGESRQGLAQIKQYLQQFGYLPSSDTYTDDFDDSLESAILSYQRNLGLNATGYLDPSTLQVMVQPRCGVADVADNGTGTRGRGLYAFFPGTPTWPRTKSVLTYALASTSAISIDQAVLRAVFARAFARWAEVTTLSFTEVEPTASPDISIGFFSGNHGDGEPFDGVLGTLAHAFSPTDGRFHLDALETWVASLDGGAASPDLLRSTVAIDLESVAVHEIGHLLGLGHSSVEGAIMYPTIRSRTRRVELARDDVDGIQSLYGNNPNFNGTSALPGSTGTATTTTTGTMRERYNGAAADGRPAVGWVALTLSAAALVAFWWGRL